MTGATLLLIRHAESDWNAAGRWQGRGDPGLSPRGRRQARELARRLADEAVGALVTSDLRRARETAEVVGGALGLTPGVDPRLRELDVGDWTGLNRSQIEARAAGALRRFEGGDPDARAGGGESRRELERRARAAAASIAASHSGRRVAVVTHLGVIRSLLPGAEPGNAEWRPLPLDAPRRARA